jgi:hypothetical protein
VKFERLIVGAAIVVVLCLYTNAFFAFFFPGEQPELLRFVLLGAPFAVLFFLFPRFALVVLAFSVYFLDWFSFYIQVLPREFTWFTDFVVVILLLRHLVLLPRVRMRPVSTVEKWIWGLLLFVIFSALVNQTPASAALIGLRLSLKYLLLFIVLCSLDLEEKFCRGLLYLQFAIALIQIPISALELKFHPPREFDPWDLMGGTFGLNATGVLAVFLLGWIAFLIATMVEQRRLRLGLLGLILLFHIPPILGEAKAFFIVLIPLILFMLRREWLKRPGLALGIGLFSFLLFVAVDHILVKTDYWISGRNPITYIMKMRSVIERDIETSRPWISGPGEGRAGRFYQAESGFHLATSSPQAFVFGFGPGVATPSFFTAQQSPSVQYFKNWGISSGATSLPWMLVEYGVVGTLLFLVPLFLLYRRARILYRSERESHRILAAGFQGLTFLFVVNLFVTATLQSEQLGYFYWVTAAIVVQLSYAVKDRNQSESARKLAHPDSAFPKLTSNKMETAIGPRS